MKCDELKPCTYDDMIDGDADINIEYYPKSDVDAAIAELKEFAEDACIERDDNQNAIDELQAENAELKQKLENAKATHYAESVDAGMRERRLKRALWRAIALFCGRSCEYFNGIMSHCLMGQDDLYHHCEKKKNKYLNAMYKCKAKSEKYK